MTIRMVREKDYCFRAEILCDHCQRPIENVGLAMVIWEDPSGWQSGEIGDLVEAQVIHKGRCDKELLQLCEKRHRPWHELSYVLEKLRGAWGSSTMRGMEG